MWLLACGAVLVWAAALIHIDVRDRRLPNALTVPGAVTILAAAAVCGRSGPSLAGAAVLAGIYLAVHLVAPHAMGAGDVKLALALGALTGAFGSAVWALAALGAPLLTAITGTVSVVRGRGTTVPHGPAMCVASLAAAALAW